MKSWLQRSPAPSMALAPPICGKRTGNGFGQVSANDTLPARGRPSLTSAPMPLIQSWPVIGPPSSPPPVDPDDPPEVVPVDVLPVEPQAPPQSMVGPQLCPAGQSESRWPPPGGLQSPLEMQIIGGSQTMSWQLGEAALVEVPVEPFVDERETPLVTSMQHAASAKSRPTLESWRMSTVSNGARRAGQVQAPVPSPNRSVDGAVRTWDGGDVRGEWGRRSGAGETVAAI